MAEEKEIGKITHYYDNISVGVVKLSDDLKTGDKVHIKGAHDDFEQEIESIQIEHKNLEKAKKGDVVGVKVLQPVHENDKVYKIKD